MGPVGQFLGDAFVDHPIGLRHISSQVVQPVYEHGSDLFHVLPQNAHFLPGRVRQQSFYGSKSYIAGALQGIGDRQVFRPVAKIQ